MPPKGSQTMVQAALLCQICGLTIQVPLPSSRSLSEGFRQGEGPMPKVFPPSCLKKPCSNFLRATCRPPPRPGGSTLLRAFFVKGRSLRAWACRDSGDTSLGLGKKRAWDASLFDKRLPVIACQRDLLGLATGTAALHGVGACEWRAWEVWKEDPFTPESTNVTPKSTS
jgi:hypothetical protein